MRQILSSFLCLLLLLGGINCLYDMECKQLHQEELESSMESAMRHSLTAARIKKSYPINSEEELYADFVGELLLTLGADAEYEIFVYDLNLEKGKMDVKIVSYFTLPGGRKTKTECRKCAVVTEV